MAKRRKSIQIITDPLLDPFFITRDEFSYAIKQKVVSDPNHRLSKGKGKEYEKTHGYFPRFTDCLRSVAKLKSELGDYESLDEFITQYKEISNQINKYIDGINS